MIFFCYRTRGMDFGPIGEKCVCICAPLDFVPARFEAKRKTIFAILARNNSREIAALAFLRLASRWFWLPSITYRCGSGAIIVAGPKTKPHLVVCVIDDKE